MTPIKKLLSFVITMSLISSCVPQRKFEDLQSKFTEADQARKECNDRLKAARESDSINEVNLVKANHTIEQLQVDSTETNALLKKTKSLYNDLSDTYERLLKYNQNENKKFSDNMKDLEVKNNLSNQQLEKKEAELNKLTEDLKILGNDLRIREDKMKQLQQDLNARQAKVQELQSVLDSKDSSVKALKNILVTALLGYKDAGLEVNIKNGKVYVSLAEQLLFASGSTVVDKKGKEALLKLCAVLQAQQDINILVEGHTDDVPMHSDKISDNWDLSVLRANSIVRILTKDGNLDPKRVIASGRGEYMPVDASKTADARKKNRRTEIILTPKLDQLLQMLETR
jgi:chemotaxis protein MotB